MNIEELIEEASKKDRVSSPCPPKKWFPESISILIRLLILPFVILDLLAQRVARWLIKPPFKRVGQCKRRGNCCQYILVRRSKGVFGWLDLFWHTQINGFYRRQKTPIMNEGKPFYLMGCRYLKKDGSCSKYYLRPTVCRTWPKIEIFGHPQILKGCGFKAVQRASSNSPLSIIDQ